jgi:hypothetical protein
MTAPSNARKKKKEKKERMVALRPRTPKHIRGGWSHYTDTREPVEVMSLKRWSLSNPGFEPATFRSLAQRANLCANRAHEEEEEEEEEEEWHGVIRVKFVFQ